MKKGYIYAITSAILFGTAGLFIKLTYAAGLDSIGLLTIQYIFAVPAMFIMAYIRNSKMLIASKKELINLAVLGIVGNTFMTIFYYKAFSYLPVAMVTMLLYTYPIMVFIYSRIFKKVRAGRKKIVALILAFIGSSLALNIIGGKVKYSALGILYGILCAVFYAFMNVYSEEHLQNTDALAINAYSTLFSLISILIYRFPVFLFKGNLSTKSYIYIALLAVVCEIIPLTLLYSSIKIIGSLKVSIIGNLEVPTAMIISFFIMHDSISITQVAGASLIVYAAYIIEK